jgi:hypothetical protein
MLTHDSQATPGNTVRIGNDEVLIVDSVPSTRGALLVVRPSADSLVHVLVYQGDLIDSEDVNHVAGPISGEGQSASDAAAAATDARLANLEAKLAQTQAENEKLRTGSGAVPVEDAEVVNEPDTPATDPTGATDAPSGTPSEPQVVQGD